MGTDTKDVVDNNTSSSSENKPSWKYRRRAVFGTLIFCAFCITYIMISGDSTKLHETILAGCFGMIFSVNAFYIGGATWEDVKLFKPK